MVIVSNDKKELALALIHRAEERISYFQQTQRKEFLQEASQILEESLVNCPIPTAYAYLAQIGFILGTDFKNHLHSADYLDFECEQTREFRKLANLPSFEDTLSPTEHDIIYIKVISVEALQENFSSNFMYQIAIKLATDLIKETEFAYFPNQSHIDLNYSFQSCSFATEYRYRRTRHPISIYLMRRHPHSHINVVHASAENALDLLQMERNKIHNLRIDLSDEHLKIATINVKLMIQTGTINDRSAATLFFNAAYINDRVMLNALSRFYPKAIDSDLSGKIINPLGLAARLGKREVVRRLLELNASVNKFDTADKTPVMRACEVHQHPQFQNNLHVIRELVKVPDVNLDLRGKEGYDVFSHSKSSLQVYIRSLFLQFFSNFQSHKNSTYLFNSSGNLS